MGAWPPLAVQAGLCLLFALWIVLDVHVLHLSKGLARSTYDAMVRHRVSAAPPDGRIVIVDIDEASLARMAPQFGRWPWPRDTLASVLDHIEAQAPLAIVWDVVFSDADRLSPGGDAAFDAAAARSAHSHFAVIRLPASNDGASRITRQALPGLWLPAEQGAAAVVEKHAVALVPPALPAIATGRLGYVNGSADADGVLRHYRYAERTPAGTIQSLPLSVARAVNPAAAARHLSADEEADAGPGRLIAWRRTAHSYQRVSFADVHARADGTAGDRAAASFKGRIVIIGATAPGLNDNHPTPLSPAHDGVDILATVLDNSVNGHDMAEFPRWAMSLMTIALCLGGVAFVRVSSASALDPGLAMFVIPAVLIAISYASLSFGGMFLELQLPAGLLLVFLAVLRWWNHLRREHWCELPPGGGQLLVWPWQRGTPWIGAALDRLIDAVQQHAPECRVVVLDANTATRRHLRWPEFACYAAIAGPVDAIEQAQDSLGAAMRRLASRHLDPIAVAPGPVRAQVAAAAIEGWAALQNSDTTRT
ncbi:MAG: CHASE2 domain-containing protein [Pseudomonadota bacterium]